MACLVRQVASPSIPVRKGVKVAVYKKSAQYSTKIFRIFLCYSFIASMKIK